MGPNKCYLRGMAVPLLQSVITYKKCFKSTKQLMKLTTVQYFQEDRLVAWRKQLNQHELVQ